MDSALSLGLLLTISILTCVGMIVAAVIKPKVQIRRIALDTYWIIALGGALLLLVFGLVSPSALIAGLTADTAINPLKILVLFLAMTFISIFLDELGFFRYVADKTVKFAGASQIRLFLAFYAVISLLTIFTSNDIIILTFTPFICYFAKYTGINPIPYLVLEFVAANTWSMILIIGNPTNIYLASSFGITFMDYLSVMALPTIAGSLIALLIIWILFHRQLSSPLSPVLSSVTLQDKIGVGIGLVHLCVCVVFLALSSYLNVEMWLVSLICACSLAVCTLILSLVRKHVPRELGTAACRVPWQFIPFILAMFTIVLALSAANVTATIAHVLDCADPVWTYGVSSFLASNLINNIPMSVLFTFVLGSGPVSSLAAGVYASVIGSNIGAFLTPIGALAGLMWMNIIKKQGIQYSFGQFIKYGMLVAVPALIAALGMLSIVLSC
ncbi:MAG TPA: ArsB/NhaD family transporter [Methanocorpusculum sp.]|nr:ArsB/NhaD family transporter [Methanocorpusculum sp.]